jgi:hypothetical protein
MKHDYPDGSKNPWVSSFQTLPTLYEERLEQFLYPVYGISFVPAM